MFSTILSSVVLFIKLSLVTLLSMFLAECCGYTTATTRIFAADRRSRLLSGRYARTKKVQKVSPVSTTRVPARDAVTTTAAHISKPGTAMISNPANSDLRPSTKAGEEVPMTRPIASSASPSVNSADIRPPIQRTRSASPSQTIPPPSKIRPTSRTRTLSSATTTSPPKTEDSPKPKPLLSRRTRTLSNATVRTTSSSRSSSTDASSTTRSRRDSVASYLSGSSTKSRSSSRSSRSSHSSHSAGEARDAKVKIRRDSGVSVSIGVAAGAGVGASRNEKSGGSPRRGLWRRESSQRKSIFERLNS